MGALIDGADAPTRTATDGQGQHLTTVTDLLAELNRLLDGPLIFKQKRHLIETLVESIRVDTTFRGTKKDAEVVVRYSFTPIDVCTDTDCAQQSG